ncbi:MAG: CAP domain-containing protein [Candidatus Dojkabacteria bacterium]
MIKNCFIPNKRNKNKPYLLRKVAVLFYSFLIIFVNSFGGFLGIEEVNASSITSTNIIALTNQERSSMGLNSLNTNAKLSAAALAKANDMFEKQYWDHFGPNGETPWQFIRGAGYNYVYAGENLAKGFKTAEGVHEAWMASPTHRANLVSNNYKDIGVAVVEGVLLGKQTTLVVQMFGNLTSEVFKASPVEEVKNSTVKQSTPEKITVNEEHGEIRSIRITSPRADTVLTDPSSSVKGDVSNVSGEYSVEVSEGGSVIGSTTSKENTWEVKKDSDWSEGSHKIKANLKGTTVSSKEVSFPVDSKSPTIVKETLEVAKEGTSYKLSFMVDGELEKVSLVLGSEITNADYEYDKESKTLNLSLTEEQVKGQVFIVLSDKSGNTSQADISEYFEKDEKEEQSVMLPILNLNLGDKISIGIVSFVFLLLCIEIFVYLKKGRCKDVLGDIFTVGLWWFVLTIAIFNGFSGSIT